MKHTIVKRRINAKVFVGIFLCWSIVGTCFAHSGESGHYHDDSTTRSVAENVSTNTNVGSAVSAHNFSASLGRYVIRGTDAGSFTINSSTGQLKTNTVLDYETKSSYSLTVAAQKGRLSPLSDSITGPIVTNYTDTDTISVTINVTDVSLQFSDGDSTTRSIAENTAANTNIGNPVAASNFNSNLDKYTLSGTDASSFKIDGSTGQLKTKASLDYEVKNSYSVTVNVFAGEQTNSEDSISVTINVTNSTDTSCPSGYTLSNNDCVLIVYGVGFGEVDTAPSVSSVEIDQLVQLLSMDKVIFNELYNGANDAHDWLELRNISDEEVDLSGWQMTIHVGSGMTTITFPTGETIPAGEVMLIVNTDPNSSESLLADPGDGSVRYVIDESFSLPPTDFALFLQGADGGYEDTVGNYFPNRPVKPETAPLLTTDVAWYRAKPAIIGYQAEAWDESGYKDGLGYDDGVSEELSLGTPGYRLPLIGDLNDDNVINILDLVLVASKFGDSSALEADLNGDGLVNFQDLVIVANGFGNGNLAAPSAKGLHASQVQQWLRLAKQELNTGQMKQSLKVSKQMLSLPIDRSVHQPKRTYEQGIQVLEQLLATLIPQSSALLPNYPNPFNPETWIPYRLAEPSEVQISIYDAHGSIVRQFDLGHQSAGLYQTRSQAAYWDGTNDMGESVASGIYFYRITAGEFSATRKMLILK